jgi:hypothetical protein
MIKRTALILFLTLLVIGCNKGPAVDPSVAKADTAIDKFLNAWIMKEPADKFANDPSVRGTDPDWQAGLRLVSFLTADTKPMDGSRVRCRVALVLQEKSGRQVEKQVDYDVQLGEPVTITRVKP